MKILGAHVSIANGFAAAATQIGQEYGCNAMQIFTKNPRGRSVKPLIPQDVEKFKELIKKYSIKYIIAHSSYLLNFGKSLKEIPWALQDIKLDFERLQQLGGNGVVVHIGKAMDGDRSKGIKNVIENAKQIIGQTEHTNLEYILENTAGQGSEIGYKFEELAKVWKGLKGFSPRIKSCLDTAHCWAAGYDISTAASTQKVLKEYDQTVGLETLSCFHFNDSKKECGSKVDRHDNIGQGQINVEGLAEIAKYAKGNSIPIILETPDKEEGNRIKDIKTVQKMLNNN